MNPDPAETATSGAGPDAIKACCAAAYQHDVVAAVLGESYHPGGLEVTRRLARALDLGPGQRVLDVASGPGTSAFLLATEFGVTIDGVDLGPLTVERATAAAVARGLEGRVRFHVGDAERLPFADASFDAVVCECALCTFPAKDRAVAEFARVLRPGGRVGITDVTLEPDRLDDELRTLAGWVACLADARPADGYATLLTDGGLDVILTEPHDEALAGMIEAIDARLRALRILNPAGVAVDVDAALGYVARAARAVGDGLAGYALFVAARPRRTIDGAWPTR